MISNIKHVVNGFWHYNHMCLFPLFIRVNTCIYVPRSKLRAPLLSCYIMTVVTWFCYTVSNFHVTESGTTVIKIRYHNIRPNILGRRLKRLKKLLAKNQKAKNYTKRRFFYRIFYKSWPKWHNLTKIRIKDRKNTIYGQIDQNSGSE